MVRPMNHKDTNKNWTQKTKKYFFIFNILYRVCVLETPFRLAICFITILHVVTTINYNYLLRPYKFTQLTILQGNIPFLTSSHIHTLKSNC
jgi:hypothetical protein